MVGPDNPHAVARSARVYAHAYRSVGVGLFSAWVVTLDRFLADAGMSVPRFLAVAASAAVAWFVIGGGSGILWSYLPQPSPRDHRDDAA